MFSFFLFFIHFSREGVSWPHLRLCADAQCSHGPKTANTILACRYRRKQRTCTWSDRHVSGLRPLPPLLDKETNRTIGRIIVLTNATGNLPSENTLSDTYPSAHCPHWWRWHGRHRTLRLNRLPTTDERRCRCTMQYHSCHQRPALLQVCRTCWIEWLACIVPSYRLQIGAIATR